MDSQELGREVERRLSKGIPAELGAGWFEGLSMKNHYALIARLTLWEKLNDYLDTLDDEEFKRALLFLRRAFATCFRGFYIRGKKSDCGKSGRSLAGKPVPGQRGIKRAGVRGGVFRSVGIG